MYRVSMADVQSDKSPDDTGYKIVLTTPRNAPEKTYSRKLWLLILYWNYKYTKITMRSQKDIEAKRKENKLKMMGRQR